MYVKMGAKDRGPFVKKTLIILFIVHIFVCNMNENL